MIIISVVRLKSTLVIIPILILTVKTTFTCTPNDDDLVAQDSSMTCSVPVEAGCRSTAVPYRSIGDLTPRYASNNIMVSSYEEGIITRGCEGKD